MKGILCAFFCIITFSLIADSNITGEVFTQMKIDESFSTKTGMDLTVSGSHDIHEVKAEFIIEKENYFDYKGITYQKAPELTLKNAFYQVNLFKDNVVTTSIQVGRFPLSSLFNSKIHFNSYVDGVVGIWKTNLESPFESYLKVAGFLRDHEWKIKNSHLKNLSGGVELGFLNVGDIGLYLSTSIFNWNLAPYDDSNHIYLEFLTAQGIIGYKNDNLIFGYPFEIFASRVINLYEKRKENTGTYFGVILGKSESKGEFCFEGMYKWIDRKALPDFDLAGIIKLDRGGHGSVLKAKYMLTDSISTEVKWEALHKKHENESKFEQVWELKTACKF